MRVFVEAVEEDLAFGVVDSIERVTHAAPANGHATYASPAFCEVARALVRSAFLDVLKRDAEHEMEAREWVKCEDEDRVFSFESACAVLGLRASYLRRMILAEYTDAQRRAILEVVSRSQRHVRRKRAG